MLIRTKIFGGPEWINLISFPTYRMTTRRSEPHYTARLLELHHDKHHAGYVAGANTTLEKLAEARQKCDFAAINQLQKNLAFHLSGHVLHSLFWHNMSPHGGGEPEGELADAIKESFGSVACADCGTSPTGRHKPRLSRADLFYSNQP